MGTRIYYNSLAEIMPADLVREIYKWIRHWNRRDATDRVEEFRQNYGPSWAAVMADISENVPRYTFYLYLFHGQRLKVSVYSPDCDPEKWPGRSLANAVITRRVASIHEEFMRSSPDRES
jgi:hypothetical protein